MYHPTGCGGPKSASRAIFELLIGGLGGVPVVLSEPAAGPWGLGTSCTFFLR